MLLHVTRDALALPFLVRNVSPHTLRLRQAVAGAGPEIVRPMSELSYALDEPHAGADIIVFNIDLGYKVDVNVNQDDPWEFSMPDASTWRIKCVNDGPTRVVKIYIWSSDEVTYVSCILITLM